MKHNLSPPWIGGWILQSEKRVAMAQDLFWIEALDDLRMVETFRIPDSNQFGRDSLSDF